MWRSESFGSLDALVAFLNDRRLHGDQFKVVAAPGEGGPAFHLLYRTDEAGALAGTAVAEVEAAPDSTAAVGEAQAIIDEARRSEPERAPGDRARG